MALFIKPGRITISPNDINQYLQKSTDSFGIFLDMDRCFEYQCIIHEKMIGIHETLKKLVGRYFDISSKQDCVEILIDFGVPGQLFGYKNNLNKEIRTAIMNNPDYSENAKLFAQGQEMYSSMRQRLSTLRSYTTDLKESPLWSKNGHRMIVAHPKWKTLNTSRQATSEPNIQAIARDFRDLITEPEGFNLVRCDSSQIEPRITWSYFWRDELIMNLINAYNDAYMGIMEYCLFTPEEEAKYRDNFSLYQKKEISPEIKEKRQTIKRFTLAASYGSTNLDTINPELSSAYNTKILKHPKRLEMEAKVKAQVERGDTTFFGAFGTPVIPEPTSKYTPGTTGWTNHVIRCGMNNPIQTTASELMLFSVNAARQILSKTENSHIAFYKHDEGCFYISDKDKENGVIEQLSEITAYNVEGWIPIPCDTEYGVLKADIPTDLD